VQGRIDAGAHGGKLVSHVEEASKLWQNLLGAVPRLRGTARRFLKDDALTCHGWRWISDACCKKRPAIWAEK